MKSISIALLCAACGGSMPTRAPAPAPFDTGDPRVGVFVSGPRSFTTNSFWIEAPEGLVLVDTQFLISDAERAVRTAEQATGKRVVLAVVLHANPDKFNGAGVLAARGIRVITSEQVRALAPDVHALRHRWFAARYEGDYPDEPPPLESFGSETTTLEVAGTEITLHVLGRGCSDAHVALEWEGHVFVGDLVANGHHSWLELGHTSEWLARLREIAALSPRFVHPGRGASGGPELLDAERDYLDAVVQIARESEPALPVDRARIEAVRSAVEARYPDLGFPVFLRTGIPAVMRRLAEARHGPM
jgi:glyoxylase-like metal-dependent hydrolase (beta-lactamase superfamily II)